MRFAAPHLKRMFPEFRTDWIVEAETWRARYAQPVVGKHYSRVLDTLTPDISNCYLATMAQIYPEDRGTNYAVRQGRAVARSVLNGSRSDGFVNASTRGALAAP